MPLQQLRNVNMGRARANATGSSGVGYTLLDAYGTAVTPRITSGVYQLTSGSGLYAAYIEFPDAFRGQILWDTGTAFPTASYATEQYNAEENDPRLGLLYQMNFGRWRIVSNQMVFYADDNATELARFDLKDASGAPTMDGVFERVKV